MKFDNRAPIMLINFEAALASFFRALFRCVRLGLLLSQLQLYYAVFVPTAVAHRGVHHRLPISPIKTSIIWTPFEKKQTCFFYLGPYV